MKVMEVQIAKDTETELAEAVKSAASSLNKAMQAAGMAGLTIEIGHHDQSVIGTGSWPVLSAHVKKVFVKRF